MTNGDWPRKSAKSAERELVDDEGARSGRSLGETPKPRHSARHHLDPRPRLGAAARVVGADLVAAFTEQRNGAALLFHNLQRIALPAQVLGPVGAEGKTPALPRQVRLEIQNSAGGREGDEGGTVG